MKTFTITTEEELNIIFHTYRMKIITQFSKMENMTATFKQIADALGDNSSKVTYHGKMLIDIGVLELSHTKIINGINAKYYKLLTENFDMATESPMSNIANKMIQKQISSTYLGIFDEMQEILTNATKFQDKNSIHISLSELYLTNEEIEELLASMHKFMDKKTPRPNTFKVDLMNILIKEKKDDK